MERKVLRHLEKRSREWGINLPAAPEAAIKAIEKKYKERGANIGFSAKRFEHPEKLDANAGLFRSSKVIFSSEWIAYLLMRNDEEVTNAFLAALGHELAHKEKYIPPYLHLFSVKFVAWVNEVYADFLSENKFLHGNRQLLLNSMNFKRSKKGEDKDDRLHPSWKRRIHYAENFETFDEKLIRQIAKDARCKNKKLIQKVIDHYTK